MHSKPVGVCPRCGGTNVQRLHRRGSWSASFSGFDAGDLISARHVTNDFCFQIRETWALQRISPVRTESANPLAATVNPPEANVNPAGALHAGRERKCSGAKGTPTRRLTVSLPSVCLRAGLPQTPGRGSRPPRAYLAQIIVSAIHDECRLTDGVLNRSHLRKSSSITREIFSACRKHSFVKSLTTI